MVMRGSAENMRPHYLPKTDMVLSQAWGLLSGVGILFLDLHKENLDNDQFQVGCTSAPGEEEVSYLYSY